MVQLSAAGRLLVCIYQVVLKDGAVCVGLIVSPPPPPLGRCLCGTAR